jgi:4-carboxymuconolactone decarboxylase
MAGTITVGEITIVPANEASWDDLQAVFGDSGDTSRCQCQHYKIRDMEWRSVPVEALYENDERNSTMPDQPSPARQLIGDFAPKLVELTDDVLFGDVWERPGLSKRDRSLVTVSALVALNRSEQLPGHLRRAIDNGLTEDELIEAITHLAFYSGWPTAMSAILAAKKLFEPTD